MKQEYPSSIILRLSHALNLVWWLAPQTIKGLKVGGSRPRLDKQFKHGV